jgi:hypothetical protein
VKLLRHITCRTHGRQRWNGEIACNRCERVFATNNATLSTHAPDVCPCGVRLMPTPGRKFDQFSARMCCSECFASRVLGQQNRGLS